MAVESGKMSFADLDDTYYYVLTSKRNRKLAEDTAHAMMMEHVVPLGFPVREVAVIVERGFSNNRFLMVWEFGVIGEITVARDHDA